MKSTDLTDGVCTCAGDYHVRQGKKIRKFFFEDVYKRQAKEASKKEESGDFGDGISGESFSDGEVKPQVVNPVPVIQRIRRIDVYKRQDQYYSNNEDLYQIADFL